jgi:hypothetical protein
MAKRVRPGSPCNRGGAKLAQMPRGESRSVPDPDGEQYDEMLRRERLKRAINEAAAGDQSASAGKPYSVATDPNLRFLFEDPHPKQPVGALDDRTLDSRDIVHPRNPQLSSDELAARRQALDRVAVMAGNPLAAAAYGVAALIGASPQARDRALLAGGAADALVMGAAPFGASRPGGIAPTRAGLPVQQFDTPAIRYRELNAEGQARGVNSTLSSPLLGTGTRAYWRRTPPGWQGEKYNQARAHLQGRQLGGDGRDTRNLVTMTHHGANTPQMRDFENAIARRVAAGEVVQYSATPIYGGGVDPPAGVLLTAHGPNGSSARYVHNPAGFRR